MLISSLYSCIVFLISSCLLYSLVTHYFVNIIIFSYWGLILWLGHVVLSLFIFCGLESCVFELVTVHRYLKAHLSQSIQTDFDREWFSPIILPLKPLPWICLLWPCAPTLLITQTFFFFREIVLTCTFWFLTTLLQTILPNMQMLEDVPSLSFPFYRTASSSMLSPTHRVVSVAVCFSSFCSYLFPVILTMPVLSAPWLKQNRKGSLRQCTKSPETLELVSTLSFHSREKSWSRGDFSQHRAVLVWGRK